MKNIDNNRPLWAPWRIDYILSDKSGECFLCNREQPVKGKDDFMVLHRGKHCFVILNAFPYNSGHLMICPYDHIKDITELETAALNEIMKLCVKSKKGLTKAMTPDGFNIGFNLGLAAGAGLEEHVHMHLVPRWNGDTNFMPVLGNTRVVPQTLEKTAELLKKHFDN